MSTNLCDTPANRFLRNLVCGLILASFLVIPASLTPAGFSPFSPTAAQAAASHWVKSGGRWWYRHGNGSYQQDGWEKVGGRWYLFDGSGWMRTGWAKRDGTWYFLDGSGAMAEGWRRVRGNWYWLDGGSGAMASGWRHIGGHWYLMAGQNDGSMLTGWQRSGGKWYWMDRSGAMATSRWVGDYWVGSSGAMVASEWVDNGRYYVGADGAWVPGPEVCDPPSFDDAGVSGPDAEGVPGTDSDAPQQPDIKKWVPEKGHNEPVYENVWVTCKERVITAVCNGCDQMFDTVDAWGDHDFALCEAGDYSHGTYTYSSKVVETGHFEKVQTGTVWVVDEPGHWE